MTPWLAAWHQRPRAPSRRQGRHAALTIGLVADELTSRCLEQECRVVHLLPGHGAAALRRHRPDLLLVESAWQGHGNRWKFRIASYPDHPERHNGDLAQLVAAARELDIPAVFWNKEDGVHFDRFIASARLFDTVLTVDASCIPRYQAILGPDARVASLMFAAAPALHDFRGIGERRHRANFVGSYGWHVHDGRRDRQDMLLSTAAATIGLTIHDRNSDRRSPDYRFPPLPNTTVLPRVPHEETGAIYRSHLVSLNVNTVEDSETMLSRRLLEILACGGLAVTTPARSVTRWFDGCCHVVDDAAAASDLFARLARDGYSAADVERIHAGAAEVHRNHTWARRLDTLLDAVRVAA